MHYFIDGNNLLRHLGRDREMSHMVWLIDYLGKKAKGKITLFFDGTDPLDSGGRLWNLPANFKKLVFCEFDMGDDIADDTIVRYAARYPNKQMLKLVTNDKGIYERLRILPEDERVPKACFVSLDDYIDLIDGVTVTSSRSISRHQVADQLSDDKAVALGRISPHEKELIDAELLAEFQRQADEM